MKNHSTDLCEVPKQPNKFMKFMMKIGKRNIIIACAVVLIGAAVWLNWMFFAEAAGNGGYGQYEEPSGNINPPSGNEGAAQVNETSYFSATKVSRQRARDEALEVLQAVVSNADSSEEVKAEALSGITEIAEEIQKEANIESLITAKGFEQCIAVLNGDKISIVVKAETLQPAQFAQINEVVYQQTGITPAAVNIIQK